MWSDTFIRASWLIYTHTGDLWPHHSAISRFQMAHDSFICDVTPLCVTWLIHTWHDAFKCDVTHSYVTRLIYTHTGDDWPHNSAISLFQMWYHAFICDVMHSYVTWLIHMWHDSYICDMTHSSVHDNMTQTICFSFFPFFLHHSYTRIQEISGHMILQLVNCICGMTHSYVTGHSYVTRPIYMRYDSFIRDMPRSYATWPIHTWHDSSICDSMDESCHIWMSHATYEWAASHMNTACHVWISHVIDDWVMSRMDEGCHVW